MSLDFASKIFAYDIFQEEDKIDKELERDFEYLKPLLENDDSELDLMSALQSQLASQNSTRKKQVVNALLYGLLTDKDRGNDYFMFLAVFVWDNFRGIVQYMLHFCGEVFPFMQIHAKHQLFWLIDQLLGKQIPEMDVVIFKLLRNVSGCDLSSSSIAIVKIVLGLLNKHKIWVLRHPKIVSMSVYVFLRCLVAHDTITDLKNSEILYCEEMLRTRFVDCAKIGRDLIRALLDLRHIPQLESLLKEIVANTGSIPGCTSLEILLHTPTSKQYHQVRTSFQIEKQLLFIMQNVKWGDNDDFYVNWFLETHFGSPGTDSIFSDAIRFIIGGFHPSNSLLASSVIPRYALIGKLLRNSKRTISDSMKLALLFDWLTYNPTKESIMNIEPSLLLMERTVEKNSDIISWIVTFLHRATHEFDGNYEQWFKHNIYSAAKTAVKAGVIKSFDKMLNNAKLDDNVQNLILNLFMSESVVAQKVVDVQKETVETVAEEPIVILETPSPIEDPTIKEIEQLKIEVEHWKALYFELVKKTASDVNKDST